MSKLNEFLLTCVWSAKRDAHLEHHFTNRYVLLSDVQHGILSHNTLSKAQRILFDDYELRKSDGYGSKYPKRCKNGLSPLIHVWTFDMRNWPISVQTTGPLKVEILEGCFDCEVLLQLVKCMPQVKVIKKAVIMDIHDPTKIAEAYQKLQYLEICPDVNRRLFDRLRNPPDHPPALLSTTSKLTKLVYHRFRFVVPHALPFGGNHMANLENLEIRGDVTCASSSRLMYGFMQALTVIGRTLRCLIIGDEGLTNNPLPPELWTSCPLLEVLDTRICIRHPAPSPEDSKLTLLRISYPYWAPITGVYILIFADVLTSFSKLRQLSLFLIGSGSTDRQALKMRLVSKPSLRDPLMGWVQVCKELQVKIVDWDGEEFDESVLAPDHV